MRRKKHSQRPPARPPPSEKMERVILEEAWVVVLECSFWRSNEK